METRLNKIFTLKPPLLILVFVLLSVKTLLWTDPDFGWRLRTGEYILNNGIPSTDLYTYTMPSFPWVDHAWSQDVLFYLLNSVSYQILSFLYAGVAIIAIAIPFLGVLSDKNGKQVFGKIDKLGLFGVPIFLLSLAVFLPYLGVRVQVFTWFLLSIFIYILYDHKLWQKLKIFTPIYFLVWANLHGGFSIGLLIFFLYTSAEVFKKRKIVPEVWFFLLSVIATLVNPYGLSLYREVWSSISDSRLRLEIVEWKPAFLSFDIPTLNIIALLVILLLRYRKKFALGEWVISLVMLFEGIVSIRNMPLFVICSVPLVSKGFSFLWGEINSNGPAKFRNVRVERFNKLSTYFWIYTLIILLLQTYFSFRGSIHLSESKFYPKEAVSYLKNTNPPGNIFSEYGWGGYLILNYPEKKVFIDGRMPSWRWNGNSISESSDVMGDYLAITKGKAEYTTIFERYNIHTVLISKKKPKDVFAEIENKFSNQYGLGKIFGGSEDDFSFADKLKEDGWKEVYRDEKARIFSDL